MTIRNSVPRIRNVRLKPGKSSKIAMLPSPLELDDTQTKLIKHGRIIATNFKPETIAGFYLIAWDRGGEYSHSYHIDGARCAIGFSLAPGFVADALRRSLHEDGHW